MNASGEKWKVTIGSTDYYFDSCLIECVSKVNDTPLISGEVYRRRALPAIYEITLGVRKAHDQMSSCKALLASAASASTTVTIGQTVFTECMLRRGGFKAAEGDDKADFEITYTGVSS